MRLLVIPVIFLCFGCGVKGPPLPPETDSATRAADVSTQPVKKGK